MMVTVCCTWLRRSNMERAASMTYTIAYVYIYAVVRIYTCTLVEWT